MHHICTRAKASAEMGEHEECEGSSEAIGEGRVMDSDEIMQEYVQLQAMRLAIFSMNDPSKENFMKFMSDCYDAVQKEERREMLKDLGLICIRLRELEKRIENMGE